MSTQTKHVVDFGDFRILFKNVGWMGGLVSDIPNDCPCKIMFLSILFIPKFRFHLIPSHSEGQP
eukprot:04733.XXX_201425_201616_1 [CDS] Oithona nana genome sequencing.